MAGTLSIEDEFELFVEEWFATLLQVRKATDARDFASVAHDIITLPQLKAGNYVSRKGYGILENVAARLLRELHISLRVSLGTARDALVESFAHDIEKRKRESFSAPAVIERTREALKSLELPSGAYVFCRPVLAQRKSAEIPHWAGDDSFKGSILQRECRET